MKNLFIIDNVIIPEPLLNLSFRCRYELCGGACCVVGDAGAPVSAEEVILIQDYFTEYAGKMEPASRIYVKTHPLYQRDEDGLSLACRDGDGPCIFARQTSTHVVCILDDVKNRQTGNTLRPLSCRLFPIRIRKSGTFYILDYEYWEECESSWNQGMRLLAFVKPVLKDKFGDEWFNRLESLVQKRSRN